MATIPFDAENATIPLPAAESDEMQDTGELIAIVKDHKIKAAMQFLRQELASGPRWASEVEAKAKAAGHAHATLVVARKRLFIHSNRVANRWQWTTAKQRQQGKGQTSLSLDLTLDAGGINHGAVTVS